MHAMNPDAGTHIQVYTAADAEFYTTSRFASTPHNDRAVNPCIKMYINLVTWTGEPVHRSLGSLDSGPIQSNTSMHH